MAGHCLKLNMLATFVKDIPKECLTQIPFQRHDVIRAGTRLAHWAVDQYRAIPPETKQQVKDAAVKATDMALRVGFPLGGLFLDFFKK